MAIEKELLGKAIRQIREMRGLSQAALAKAVGLQGNSVALIERGQRGVSMETLNELADVLRIPAACLTIMGTAKIAGQSDSAALIKSMQELIRTTVSAQSKLENQEGRRAKAKPLSQKSSRKLEHA